MENRVEYIRQKSGETLNHTLNNQQHMDNREFNRRNSTIRRLDSDALDKLLPSNWGWYGQLKFQMPRFRICM